MNINNNNIVCLGSAINQKHIYEHHCIRHSANPQSQNVNSIQFNIINSVKDAWQTREDVGDWYVKNIGNTKNDVRNAVYTNGNSACPNIYFSDKDTMFYADGNVFKTTNWGIDYFEDKVRTII